MPTLNEEAVREALRAVKYPGFSRDIVSFGLVEAAEVRGDEVFVKLSLAVEDPKIAQQIHRESMQALSAVPGVRTPHVLIDLKKPPAAASPGATKIEGVKHVIAVASGKGGVGKSTVASNLAQALSLGGARTGLCDCDLYGPSIALMFGTTEQPCATEDNRIVPIERYGLKLMSMGFLTDADTPAVLRGPMVTRYTQQFLRQVDWGVLDYLILELPPGTGDIQLTLVQKLKIDGVLIVSTPQEIALIDARRAAAMFRKTETPLLGVVENMAWFEEPSTGARIPIFGEGGARAEAVRLGVPLLAEIPLETPLRAACDEGRPGVLSHPDSASSRAFAALAAAVA
jgi:ATP-binding protein involved in chromosome partitioning